MKNETIGLDITDITPEGYGVGRVKDGRVVFVSGATRGDRVEALIIKELKNHSVARISRLVSPSPDRIDIDCPCFERCGGCVFRQIGYQAELELKRSFVREAFARIGGLEVETDEVIHGNEFGYRNKVQYPFAPDKNGRNMFGYYSRRSHRIIQHSACLLQNDDFHAVAEFVAQTADKLGIPPYNEENGRGIIRHAVMRRSREGEMLLCLVVTESTSPALKRLCGEVYDRFPFLVGVHINVNPKNTNVIFGEHTVKAEGDNQLTDTLCGRKFAISPLSFYQVNAEMAEKLYSFVKDIAEIGENDILLDLYCGAGTVGLCAAGEGNMLCGAEIVSAAVLDAEINAGLNGRSKQNTLFVCGDAAEGVSRCEKRFGKPDVIFLDPPRKGLEPEVIKNAVAAQPKKIVCISCNPATLARDCALFAESGYTTRRATPFDLFPRTGHVETVVLLTKGSK